MIITRGDTVIKRFRYLDRDGDEIRLTNQGKITFTVRDKIDGEEIFHKIITDSDYNVSEGCYEFVIEPEDTKNINLDGREKIDYRYDYELNDYTNNVNMIATIDKGLFTITYDITME